MADSRLAEIDGIKPNRLIADGEEIMVRSESSKSKTQYKIKRLNEDISCSCPAWRNQKKLVGCRTCKHLKGMFGQEYEEARVRLMESDIQDMPKTENPKNKGETRPAVKGRKRKRAEEDEKDGEKLADEESIPPETVSTPHTDDPLGSIDGVTPLVYMADGAEKEVESQTSNSKYKVKRTYDHYYCTCPAWRMQKDTPVNARSCKHIRGILGDAYEDARIKKMNPAAEGRPPASKKAKIDSKKKDIPGVLLAVKWDLEGKQDPTGWWCSEKLDGVRAYYDGKAFMSRNGNFFDVPRDLLELLPKELTLDGELFGGRGTFNDTVSVVRSATSPKWKEGKIKYLIFDIPSEGSLPFEERVAKLEELFGDEGTHKSDFVKNVEQTKVENKEHVLNMLKNVEAKSGEGLMLRKPGSKYEGKRSNTLQKIKTFHDAEARVVGYMPGKGKHKGVTGALKCEMASGKTFSVGSGMSDGERAKPPNIGTIITYRFQELTPDKVPRFPTYVGVAIDKDEPTDPVPVFDVEADGDDI